MDFCDMGSLADVLNTSLLRNHAGKVAMPAILQCLLEVASALHYLHAIGGRVGLRCARCVRRAPAGTCMSVGQEEEEGEGEGKELTRPWWWYCPHSSRLSPSAAVQPCDPRPPHLTMNVGAPTAGRSSSGIAH